jgi:hypothetical protein
VPLPYARSFGVSKVWKLAVNYFALDDENLITVKDWIGLLFVVEETIATCERLYDHMMVTGSAVADWKELQSPELTELLDAIRRPPKDPLASSGPDSYRSESGEGEGVQVRA